MDVRVSSSTTHSTVAKVNYSQQHDHYFNLSTKNKTTNSTPNIQIFNAICRNSSATEKRKITCP
jgi:hypothetical protein